MKRANKLMTGVLLCSLLASAAPAQQENPAAAATNKLGLDLYRLYAAAGGDLCLSPYSIQSAFAMTTNGADGKTLQEMLDTLHYPQNLSALNAAFAQLAADFEKRQAQAAELAKRIRRGDGEPGFQLMVANRLFGQKGYPFEAPFLKVAQESHHAPLQFADFKHNFARERKVINKWVEKQTRERIVDLLPEGSLNPRTRLVLVNALYFKAAWRHQFNKSATAPAPFHLQAEKRVEVPTMHTTQRFGYAKENGYTAVTLPYSQGFSMLLLVPDEVEGLAAVDEKLTAGKLASLARLRPRKVSLYLPRFKIEGETIALEDPLTKLGMKLAFDEQLANFDRMTADKTLPGLYIDDAYHKTFIAVDEKGTEAAAATAVVMAERTSLPRPEQPVELRIDRPFFYAIMDTASRTALFLGRVADPR